MSRAWSAPSAPEGQRIDVLTGNQQAVPALARDFLEVSTGAELGFVQRRVFVAPGSSRLGTLVGPTVAEAITTIFNAEQLGPGRLFQITCCPASPGAGAGEAVSGASAAAVFGSAGPGGGARAQAWFTRAQLLAQLPIVITCGLGGTGSAPVTSTTATITLPAVPTAPSVNVASFGNLLRSFCGGTGRARSTTGATNICSGGGGGWEGPGQPGASGVTAVDGGIPWPGISGTLQQNGSLFGGGASLNNTPNSGTSLFGGGAGGTAATTAGLSTPGAASPYGGGGGGIGGRAANAVVTANGLAGGSTSVTPGGAGGGSTGPGADGLDSAWPETSMGGAAGGGAAGVGANATGFRGGNGGFPGGAPGGGGPASASAGTATSGAGGNGADGCVVLVAIA